MGIEAVADGSPGGRDLIGAGMIAMLIGRQPGDLVTGEAVELVAADGGSWSARVVWTPADAVALAVAAVAAEFTWCPR